MFYKEDEFNNLPWESIRPEDYLVKWEIFHMNTGNQWVLYLSEPRDYWVLPKSFVFILNEWKRKGEFEVKKRIRDIFLG